MKLEFVTTEETFYKKTMTIITTLDQKTTSSYVSKQSTELKRCFIFHNRLI